MSEVKKYKLKREPESPFEVRLLTGLRMIRAQIKADDFATPGKRRESENLMEVAERRALELGLIEPEDEEGEG